jgi:hypothetical protein
MLLEKKELVQTGSKAGLAGSFKISLEAKKKMA